MVAWSAYGRARRLRSELTSADRSVRSARRFGDQVLVEGGPLDTPRGPTHAHAGPARETVVPQEVATKALPYGTVHEAIMSPHFREV